MLKWPILKLTLCLNMFFWSKPLAPSEHKRHTLFRELSLPRHQATYCIFKIESLSCIRNGGFLPTAENDNGNNIN